MEQGGFVPILLCPSVLGREKEQTLLPSRTPYEHIDPPPPVIVIRVVVTVLNGCNLRQQINTVNTEI